MKKFGMLLMCLGLSMFTIGCQPSETTTPVGNGDSTTTSTTDESDEGGVIEPDTATTPSTDEETK